MMSGSTWKCPGDLRRSKQQLKEVNWSTGRNVKPKLTHYKADVLLAGYQPPLYSASSTVAAVNSTIYTPYCAAYLARTFNL